MKIRRSYEPEIIQALILIIESQILCQPRNVNDVIRLLLDLKEAVK